MLGYLDDAEATAEIASHARRRPHSGSTRAISARWTRTASSTSPSRSKRMIKSSGFNVYPSQVESGAARAPGGGRVVRDRGAGRVAGSSGSGPTSSFAIPRSATDALAAELIAHCRERLIKWSCPRDVVFRDELPLTKIGKVDFRALEAEATSTASP